MGRPPTSLLSFDQALDVISSYAAKLLSPPPGRRLQIPSRSDRLPLLECMGRVLAEPVVADRDQPPFDRSTRDGFAVHSAEFSRGDRLAVVGQVRAGTVWTGNVAAGQAIEIMTGAPVPQGTDSVAMVEHVTREGAQILALPNRALQPGDNIVPRSAEARSGDTILSPGLRIGPAHIALASSFGYCTLHVHARPQVAILSTGDELVELDTSPAPHQIRNSNSYTLAALVLQNGGEPIRLPIVPDDRNALHANIQAALSADLVLLTGGVSMGEYDLVEEVLLDFGAEFAFTGVLMQPGKPVVFGSLPRPGSSSRLPLFGLPGNPISAQVTFHCFAAPLLHALCAESDISPRFLLAALQHRVDANPILTRVLPARLGGTYHQPELRLIPWRGSGDLAANARADCYAVLPPRTQAFAPGEPVTVLLR